MTGKDRVSGWSQTLHTYFQKSLSYINCFSYKPCGYYTSATHSLCTVLPKPGSHLNVHNFTTFKGLENALIVFDFQFKLKDVNTACSSSESYDAVVHLVNILKCCIRKRRRQHSNYISKNKFCRSQLCHMTVPLFQLQEEQKN